MDATRTALLSLLLLLTACGRNDWPSEEERTLKEGHAPTPYTAEQIRDGCPSGRVCVFEIASSGAPAITKRYRFLDADEQGVTIESSVEGPGDRPPTRSRSTWRELQSHASFPADAVEIREQRVETPAGTFDCLRYTVTTKEGNKRVVKTLDFARELPGMPVRMTLEYDGNRISTMTLVRHGSD